jgi:glycosyltransferase involved in cell wall biosynthesis
VTRRRVLVVSNEVVGARMAGPGIRSWRLAQELTSRHEVTLAVPNEPELEAPGLRVVRARADDDAAIGRLLGEADAVVTQRLSPRLMLRVARSKVLAVYDLYSPVRLENAPAAREAPAGQARHERTVLAANAVAEEIVLRSGDAFICASERQRDFWLGCLSALGRLDHRSFRRDPTLRALLDVVPFGIEPEPPAPGPAAKGVLRGIGPTDTLLLWPGGVWNWLDPLTVVRAVGSLRERRPDVRLLFLGVRHPNPRVEPTEAAARAVGLSRELGLLGEVVFFQEQWVPYAERGRFLLEADVAVSAHLDTLESRLSFRTRLLDCFWAGLPIVATGGDELADRAASRGGAVTVPAGDEVAFAAALEGVLADRDALPHMQRALAPLREELLWPRVAEPLARLVEQQGEPLPVPGGRRLLGRQLAARARWSLEVRGGAGLAARAAATLAAPFRGDGSRT